ncbi:uncharacterized protein LOC134196151 isoform X2 [Corticium candelabrum]|uniref:uncharacterized protein LOC134196151 isoform X2 n=1 Tax=Corticium candelabrum TaxID=121492 RepID=UPI002E2733EB|nr:uncharacterized protein LOC134196151 isoform X2 [Corticium candelabrum]
MRQERHKAEIRRAVNDEELERIADKLNGEDTSTGWSEEGRRPCPFSRPRVVPVKHLQNLINSGVATVTASVALGLADLPRNEAESPTRSSQLQTSGLFGLQLSSSKATMSSSMSVAVAKILESSANAHSEVCGLDAAESHRKEITRPTRQGRRRGTKRKYASHKTVVSTSAISPCETGYQSSQYEAASAFNKKLVTCLRAVDTQTFGNKPFELTKSMPVSVSMSQESELPVSVSLTPVVFHTSGYSSPVPSVAVVTTTSTVTSLGIHTTTTTRATTKVLGSLSINRPSCAVSLTPPTVSQVRFMCPVTAIQHESTLQLTQSLSDMKSSIPRVTSSSVLLTSSFLKQLPVTTSKPLYSQSVLSRQALTATTSLLSCPSRLSVTSSLNSNVSLESWVSCAVPANPATTASTTTTAQLFSGTLVNQQSLRTLGNVYVMSSSDGQPGRAILLPHHGTSTTPSAFSLIPLSAANIVPSQPLPSSHTPLSGVNLSSLSHSDLTTSTVSKSVQAISACCAGAPLVNNFQSVTTRSISKEQVVLPPASGQTGTCQAGAADFTETGSPDSEVTQAAKELVRLQTGSGSSSDSTTALLLRNPSLLEATTTLLSLQTSAVAPASRVVSDHDKSKNQEHAEMCHDDEETIPLQMERKEATEQQQHAALHIGECGAAQELKQDMLKTSNNSHMSAQEVLRFGETSSLEVREDNSSTGKGEDELVVQSFSEASTVISPSVVSASSGRVIASLPDQLFCKGEGNLKNMTPTLTTATATSIVPFVLTTTTSAGIHTAHSLYSTSSSLGSLCSQESTEGSSQQTGSCSPHLLSCHTLQPAAQTPNQSACLTTLGSAVQHKKVGHSLAVVTPHLTSDLFAKQQGFTTPSSSPTLRQLSSTRQDTSLRPFPVVSTLLPCSGTIISTQSPLTQPSWSMPQGVLVSSCTSHSHTGAIHLRIQGSTVTAQQSVATSLSGSGTSSQAVVTTGNTQQNRVQPISLRPSSLSAHVTPVASQPAFSDVHSMLDVFRDMTTDSQLQDESDADQLKSIIDELGVNLDDPESFLSSDHLSFEASLDPDILSDVFAAISAADTTVSHSSSSLFASVSSLTNELTVTRNLPVSSFDQPYTHSHQTHRDSNQGGNKGRGKRPSHLERSVSYSYPTTRPANIITTRRSSAAASLTDHSDGDDSSGLRHSKRKRKLTAVMTDDPYPAPRTETITVPSWIKAALALMYRVCRVRGSNRPKSEASASSWFLDPIDLNEVPDYCDKVKHPMDFTTIKKKLEAGLYSHYSQWNADMQLVQQNCYTYNPPGHIVRIDCDEVFRFYNAAYEKLVERWQRTPELIEKTTTLQRPVEC